MASHLAKIHGTEEDKVNCPFYYKIGACRHGDRCSRLHHKPAFSQTLLVKHLYQNPQAPSVMTNNNGNGPAGAGGPNNNNPPIDQERAVEEYLSFYEDMYMEFSKFGRIDELHIVENLGDHMIGHIYIKFQDEEQASDALHVMNGRYYDGRLMEIEFSPVTDFREARCRDYDEDLCKRGGYCNFLHVKPIPICLLRSMDEDAEMERRRQLDQESMAQRDPKQQPPMAGEGGGSGDRGGGGGRGGDRRSSSSRRDKKRRRKEHKRDRRDRRRDRDRKRSRSRSGSPDSHNNSSGGEDDSRTNNNNDDDNSNSNRHERRRRKGGSSRSNED